MKINITTQVRAPLAQVKDGFTQELFLALNPPFPPVKLVRFDGCQTGDQVELVLNFVLFKQQWVSDITEDCEELNRWYFVDVGTKLPFFLKSWKHHHEVVEVENSSKITDTITYSTGTLFTDLLMYPFLLGQFLYRKPIYRSHLSTN